MSKKRVTNSAESLGREFGGHIFKNIFGAIVDVIDDAIGSNSEDEEYNNKQNGDFHHGKRKRKRK